MKVNVINLYGGPGCGKSTLAAETFSQMKKLGYNVELVTEYAKDCVWRESMKQMTDQVYMLAKQHHRVAMLTDVEWIVTDSPILLPILYDHGQTKQLKALALELYARYENYNFLLNRAKAYNPLGRTQTEAEAKVVDKLVESMLIDCHEDYVTIEDPTRNGWENVKHWCDLSSQDPEEIGTCANGCCAVKPADRCRIVQSGTTVTVERR